MDTSSPTIRADTIARTIILLLALVNQLLAIFGHSAIAFADNDIYQIVSACWTVPGCLVEKQHLYLPCLPGRCMAKATTGTTEI